MKGAFGRRFTSHVQPLEIARKLRREMDSFRQRTVREVYVPNEYTVFLSDADYETFAGVRAAITSELAEYLAEHARREGYALLTRPRVILMRDNDLAQGMFGIATATTEAAEPGTPDPVQATMVQPAAVAAPAPTRSLVLTWSGARLVLSGEAVRIGRGKSNDVVIDDSSVSREHAVVAATPQGWMLRDLGSTNGTAVNGARVREHRLAPGDRVLLGSVEVQVGET